MDTSYLYVTMVYTARMFGMSILMMPIMTAGLNELPMRLNPYGTAMVNTMRMIAGAVGMAFLVTVMSSKSAVHIRDIVVKQHIVPTDKHAMMVAVNQGTVMGINDAFMVATVLAAVAFVLSFFIHKTVPLEDLIANRSNKPNRGKALGSKLAMED